MQLGNLSAIWSYPVKSLLGTPLTHAAVESDGIPGDRSTSLIVHDGHARIGKAYRGKENERLHRTGSVQTAIVWASERGVGVRAVGHEVGHDYDAAPISLIVDRWLDSLSAHVGYPVEYQRFRANFLVAADPQFDLEEGALIGAELRLGTVRLHVIGEIKRCVTPTYHLSDGANDPGILRYIAQKRGNAMGVYCTVLQPGDVEVGATVLRAS